MKVLHLIDSGGLYGAEVVLLNLMEEQKRTGMAPILGSIGNRRADEKPLESAALEKGLTLRRFTMANGPNILGALNIIRFARKERVEIIHSHGYKGNILMGFLPRWVRPIPLVVTLHGWTSAGEFSRMKLYEWADRRSLKFADHVVTVDKSLLTGTKLARDLNGKFSHVPNGIPLKPGYHDTPLDDDIKFFCSQGFVVGSIGRLSCEKNFAALIKAISSLKSADRLIKLIIIGDGPQRNDLEKLAHDCGIADNVFFSGYRSNAARYLPIFNLFVLPSVTEGQPVTVLEAMQAGIPVVASSVGGIPELLDNGKAGLIVKKGDITALTQAIDDLYKDDGKRIKLSEISKKRILERYNSSIMANEYSMVYKRVILKKSAH